MLVYIIFRSEERDIDLEPGFAMSWDVAADLATEGTVPVHLLYWPTGGMDHADGFHRLRANFAKLNLEYTQIRKRYGL